MTRRRLLQVLAAACLLAVPFVIQWAMAPAPGVTFENFKRLHAEMTIDEMNAIMGEDAKMGRRPMFGYSHGHWLKENTTYEWIGEGGSVLFKVFGKSRFGIFNNGSYSVSMRPGPESMTTKLRRWLGFESEEE